MHIGMAGKVQPGRFGATRGEVEPAETKALLALLFTTLLLDL
jgi:hypothetical protein